MKTAKTKEKFTAVILAGGKSSRMGTDKAQLIYKDSTFLRIQGEKLREAGASQLLISSNYCTIEGWETVQDIFPDLGPMCGIYSAMLKSENDICMFLTIDSVGITKDIILSLLRTHIEKQNDVTLIRKGGEIVEPLIGIYSRSLTGQIGDDIMQGKLKIIALVDNLAAAGHLKLGYLDIPVHIITNCNTRRDYEELAGM